MTQYDPNQEMKDSKQAPPPSEDPIFDPTFERP